MKNYQEYYPKPLSLKSTKIIYSQMIECVCKVYLPYGEFGTGFFVKIPCKNKMIPTLISSNYVLNKYNLHNGNEIHLSLEEDKKITLIKLNDKNIIYTNKELDITIIEIIEKDYKKDISFLELDDIVEKNNIPDEYYRTENIYMIQYNEKEVGLSYGFIKKLDNKKIIHTCCFRRGSSGSPILNSSTQKVIGIHTGSTQYDNFGFLIKYAIEDFIKFYLTNDINFKEYKESDFTNLKLLSEGSCGVVYSAYSEQDNNEICLKKINIEKMSSLYQKIT